MSHHKWGIFWLVMLAWNAAAFGSHLGSDMWWRAGLDLLVAFWMAVMAYRDLTGTAAYSRRPGTVTITIRPDTRGFDDAMKRATLPPLHGGYRATPRRGGYTGGPKPPNGPGGGS
jgi:hypothetical protein